MNYDHNDPARENDPNRVTDMELLAELMTRMTGSTPKETTPAESKPAGETSTIKSINLVELFYYFVSKLGYIVLGMVIGGLLMGIFAKARIMPVYSATSKLYIMGSTGTSIISDLQIGSVLTMDYQEVFNTWEVHQMVNEKLGTNYSYSALQGMISIENPDGTRVLYITARNTDAQMAADIANAYAASAKEFIVEIMKTDEPTDFSIALVPGAAMSASITSYVIKGMLAGTVLVCGILLLVMLLDKRPKNADDIMYYAGIPTLAVIPKNSVLAETKKSSKGARKE